MSNNNNSSSSEQKSSSYSVEDDNDDDDVMEGQHQPTDASEITSIDDLEADAAEHDRHKRIRTHQQHYTDEMQSQFEDIQDIVQGFSYADGSDHTNSKPIFDARNKHNGDDQFPPIDFRQVILGVLKQPGGQQYTIEAVCIDFWTRKERRFQQLVAVYANQGANSAMILNAESADLIEFRRLNEEFDICYGDIIDSGGKTVLEKQYHSDPEYSNSTKYEAIKTAHDRMIVKVFGDFNGISPQCQKCPIDTHAKVYTPWLVTQREINSLLSKYRVENILKKFTDDWKMHLEHQKPNCTGMTDALARIELLQTYMKENRRLFYRMQHVYLWINRMLLLGIYHNPKYMNAYNYHTWYPHLWSLFKQFKNDLAIQRGYQANSIIRDSAGIYVQYCEQHGKTGHCLYFSADDMDDCKEECGVCPKRYESQDDQEANYYSDAGFRSEAGIDQAIRQVKAGTKWQPRQPKKVVNTMHD